MKANKRIAGIQNGYTRVDGGYPTMITKHPKRYDTWKFMKKTTHVATRLGAWTVDTIIFQQLRCFENAIDRVQSTSKNVC